MGQVGEGASALFLMQDKLATGITFLGQLDAPVGSCVLHDETGVVENRAPRYVLDVTKKSQTRHRKAAQPCGLRGQTPCQTVNSSLGEPARESDPEWKQEGERGAGARYRRTTTSPWPSPNDR